MQERPWLIKDLSASMHISQSEVSESLHRSMYAELIDEKKQRVLSHSLFEFLIYGLRYVFPQKPGHLLRGLPTAHSHPSMQTKFITNTTYVWPDAEGQFLGHAIEPFYAKQVNACHQDDHLYLILSLIEVIRVGKVREISYVKEQLKKLFDAYQ